MSPRWRILLWSEAPLSPVLAFLSARATEYIFPVFGEKQYLPEVPALPFAPERFVVVAETGSVCPAGDMYGSLCHEAFFCGPFFLQSFFLAPSLQSF